MDCEHENVPILKGDKLSLTQCPKNEAERDAMKKVSYASALGSIMYAQVCIRSDIVFVMGLLGRYQSDLDLSHWVAAKKVLRYLKGTRDYIQHTDPFLISKLVGYTDFNLVGYEDDKRFTSGYVFLMEGGTVSWKSTKQTLVTTSTIQVEFITYHGLLLRLFDSEIS
ncbi:secreted RxLR effector protein 161-like [Telopea speciosissima]|uniref:secreted RxLR effector protein 161-like n=1 Tax=Telopea speciosissima TaxID=54955 RepID=UPI001CC3526C|nr:secreted RxLR effector protein 161-like [Telopea speciosissima]